VKSAGDIWPDVDGKEKLCHHQDDNVLKGRKVWRPVISAPNAKLPFPSCSGVEFEDAWRMGLKMCSDGFTLIFAVADAKSAVTTRVVRVGVFIVEEVSMEALGQFPDPNKYWKVGQRP
jgi:hypothetical protein